MIPVKKDELRKMLPAHSMRLLESGYPIMLNKALGGGTVEAVKSGAVTRYVITGR